MTSRETPRLPPERSVGPDPVVLAQSTFAAGADGWTVQIGYPSAQEIVAPVWQTAQSGFRGGTVSIATSVTSHPSRAYFVAPSSFRGDVLSAYGQVLTWQISLGLPPGTLTTEFYTGNRALIVVGARKTLWFGLPMSDTWNQGGEQVQTIAVTLDETSGAFVQATMARATQDDFEDVLSDVRAILIRADYYDDVEQWDTTLGNVTLYGAGLDPLLAQLQADLSGTYDPVLIDAPLLGSAGDDVVAVLGEELSAPRLAFDRVGLEIGPDDSHSHLIVRGKLSGTFLGMSGATATATFGVAGSLYTLRLDVPCPPGWQIIDTFPDLGLLYVGDIAFVHDEAVAPSPAFHLSSVNSTPAENPVVRGLSLSGSIAVAPPLDSALILLPAMPNPLSVRGPVKALPDDQWVDLVGVTASIEIHLPSPVRFDENSLEVWGRVQRPDADDPDTVFTWEEIGFASDVTIGGVTLPLLLVLPLRRTGWGLALRHDRQARLGDVAGFLGFFSGADLSAALPDGIEALNVAILENFVVLLAPDRTSIDAFEVGFASDATAVWEIVPETLELAGIGVTLEGFRDGSAWVVGGFLTATFALAGRVRLSVSLPLPTNRTEWLFTASTTQPVTLSDFDALLGSSRLAQQLPGDLGDINGFVLNSLAVAWDPRRAILSRVSIAMTLWKSWAVVVDRLTLKTFSFSISVSRPLTAQPTLAAEISCTLDLVTIELDAVLTKSAGASWSLDVFVEEVDLPTLGALSDLVGLEAVALVPEGMRDFGFTLTDLAVETDLSRGTIERVRFTVSTASWTIVPGLLSTYSIYVSVDVDWRRTPVLVKGKFVAEFDFAGAFFLVGGERRANGSWALSIDLVPTSPLSLMSLADAVASGYGTSLRSLGVPDVTLVEATGSYDTATGAYDLAGRVGLAGADNEPWSVDVGVSSLTIRELGLAVDSVLAGDVRRTTTRLTGSLTVGPAAFDVSYVVGGELKVTGTLVDARHPVLVLDLVEALASPGAASTSWTSAFASLDDMTLSDVRLELLLGSVDRSFLLRGKLTTGVTTVDALFVVKKVGDEWQFALAAKVHSDWTLQGFTDAFQVFKIDRASWGLVASSFRQDTFVLPADFDMPLVKKVRRGLNFYGRIDIRDTIATMRPALESLPEGTVDTNYLTVTGGLLDPLADSYLDVLLSADAEGVPLLGWQDVRVAELALRLRATSAVGFYGRFQLRTVKDAAGNPLSIELEMMVSAESIEISVLPTKGRTIFTWADALDIEGLDVYLTELALKLVFTGPVFGGTIGGGVEFSSETSVPALAGVRPDPVVTRLVHERLGRAFFDTPLVASLVQALDAEVSVEMSASFLVVGGSPIPRRLAGRFSNFTIPYLLKRFADVDLPDVLAPIYFPRIEFDVSFDPAEPAKPLRFFVDGEVVVFGFHGTVYAHFDETRVTFNVATDPIRFQLAGKTIVALQRTSASSDEGPYISIDTKPPTGHSNVEAELYCSFFGVLTFEGRALVKYDAADPKSSMFVFSLAARAGSLLAVELEVRYTEALHLVAEGTASIDLGAFRLPGFAKDGVTVADAVEVTKDWDLAIEAALGVDLDARAASPAFSGHLRGLLEIEVDGCSIVYDLSFALTITPDLMRELPEQIISQLGMNVASIFEGVLDTAQCFAGFVASGLLELGLEGVAKVFHELIPSTGIFESARLLAGLGATAADVAAWLWDIFDSHDTRANARALHDAGAYTPEEIAKAINDSAPEYTPQQLVADLIDAHVHPADVVKALLSAFPETPAPSAARWLYENGVDLTTLAGALRRGYPGPTATADAMYALLAGTDPAAHLAAMAAALAPHYVVAAVAAVLFQKYRHEGRDPTSLLNALLDAYAAAAAPLDRESVVLALAPLFPTPASVAPSLESLMGIATPQEMVDLLRHGYGDLGLEALAKALAACTYGAPKVAEVLRRAFPQALQTADAMEALLYDAFAGAGKDLGPAEMLAVLVTEVDGRRYPAAEILPSLLRNYSVSLPEPAAMLPVAGPFFDVVQIAPGLRAAYPAALPDPSVMLAALQDGYYGPLDVVTAAEAVASADYDVTAVAAALRTSFGVGTAAAMASLLLGAYPEGAITAPVMTGALMGQAFPAGDVATVLIDHYAADVATPRDMAGLLVEAGALVRDVAAAIWRDYRTDLKEAAQMVAALSGYDLSEVAPVVQPYYPALVRAADLIIQLRTGYAPRPFGPTAMTAALRGTTFEVPEVAAGIYEEYGAEVRTASALSDVLYEGLGDRLTAPGLAESLHATGFDIRSAADELGRLFPDDVSTAVELTGTLAAAFPDRTVEDLTTAVGSRFRAFETAAAVAQALRPSAEKLALALILANPPSTLSPLAAATALASSGYDEVPVAAALGKAFPDLWASFGQALAEVATATGTTTFVSELDNLRAQGLAAPSAAAQIAQHQPGLSLGTIAAGVVAVYSAPPVSGDVLAQAVGGAPADPPAPADLVRTLALYLQPQLEIPRLLRLLLQATHASGRALDESAAVLALRDGLATLSRPIDLTETAIAFVAVYRDEGDPALLARALAAVFDVAGQELTFAATLRFSYAMAGLELWPADNLRGVRAAYDVAESYPQGAAPYTGDTYGLRGRARYIAALAVANRDAGFLFPDVCTFLEAYYGHLWDDRSGYATTLEVYQLAVWEAAGALRDDGCSPAAAAVELKAIADELDTASLVRILVGTYGLVHAGPAVRPMAAALRSTGVVLADALAAMEAEYSGDWTEAHETIVREVYAEQPLRR